MNRRLFFALAAGAIMTPEGLWTPDKKSIFLPARFRYEHSAGPVYTLRARNEHYLWVDEQFRRIISPVPKEPNIFPAELYGGVYLLPRNATSVPVGIKVDMHRTIDWMKLDLSQREMRSWLGVRDFYMHGGCR
jgi:hypothetical protein